MKLFLKKVLLVFVLSMLIMIPVSTLQDVLGWSDFAYKRMTVRNHKSLIIGTSRAAQGIQPSIINENLSDFGFKRPIYNFSFTVADSPYGEVYYNAIKRVIDNEEKNGVFIVSVDPWSLSFDSTKDKPNNWREEGSFLDRNLFYSRPNFFYLWFYSKPYKMLMKSDNMILHDDGWLEVTGIPMDSVSLNERIEKKLLEYKDVSIVKSEYRLFWLKQIILLCKEHGAVYLCRIPASKEFLEKENFFWPEFESDMNFIADSLSVSYISFGDRFGDYRTTDAQHLYKEDGALFSKDLCDSLHAHNQLHR